MDSNDFIRDIKMYWLAEFFEKKMDSRRKEILAHKLNALYTTDPDHPILLKAGLLSPLSLGVREIAHTSFLSWILDPAMDGEHGFGDSLLRALLSHLCNEEISTSDISDVVVESERSLDHEDIFGRIDIRAVGLRLKRGKSVPWSIWIEAKISATDSIDQLEKYTQEIMKWEQANPSGESYPVFMTPDGRTGKSGPVDRWHRVHYESLVAILWTTARATSDAAGYHLLRHYLAGVMKDVLGWPILLPNARVPYAAISLLDGVSVISE